MGDMATHREVIGGAAQPEMEPTLANRTTGTSSVGFHYADLGTPAAQLGDVCEECGTTENLRYAHTTMAGHSYWCEECWMEEEEEVEDKNAYTLVVCNMDTFADMPMCDRRLRLVVYRTGGEMVGSHPPQWIGDDYVEFCFHLPANDPTGRRSYEDDCYYFRLFEDKRTEVRVERGMHVETVYKFAIQFQN